MVVNHNIVHVFILTYIWTVFDKVSQLLTPIMNSLWYHNGLITEVNNHETVSF